jgi:hypothetical protein
MKISSHYVIHKQTPPQWMHYFVLTSNKYYHVSVSTDHIYEPSRDMTDNYTYLQLYIIHKPVSIRTDFFPSTLVFSCQHSPPPQCCLLIHSLIHLHPILITRTSGPSLLLERAMKASKGRRGIIPLIINLGTRWRWLVSFTFHLLYSQCPLNKWLRGFTVGVNTEHKYPALPGNRSLDRPAWMVVVAVVVTIIVVMWR